MIPLSSKQQFYFSLTGIAFMLAITQLPPNPFDETPTDWRLWGVGLGLLLGAATRSGCKVAYQWSYQRERKKYKVRSR
jgi:hypothetical protein